MSSPDAGASGRPQGPTGRLWVVATPLGNLGDITARAREAIAECDLVACEDTRVTGGLLRHLAISKPMLAYHEHNEKDAAVLIALLLILQGQIWLGKGGVPTVIELENKIKEQNELNAKAKRINGQLSSEVNDLKEGLNAVEERARHELGMVKSNEIFVQIEK